MNSKIRLAGAVMVFLGMLSVLALPMVTAEDGLPDDIALDDDTIECNQVVWVRVDMGAPYEDAPAYCNLTDPHGAVYYLGLVTLDKAGLGNWSYAPDCTGGTWIVNVTIQIGYGDGGGWESVLLTFTMQSAMQCVTSSINELMPTLLYIVMVIVLIILLLILVTKVTDKGKKVD